MEIALDDDINRLSQLSDEIDEIGKKYGLTPAHSNRVSREICNYIGVMAFQWTQLKNSSQENNLEE